MNLVTQKCIGRNLRLLRVYHGLTQQAMSENVGITRSLYVQYELGNRAPDAEALFNISHCFGIEMSLFFEQNPDTFLSRLSYSRAYEKAASDLLNNYQLLSSFSKGRLLEYSGKLLEWDNQKTTQLKALNALRRTSQ